MGFRAAVTTAIVSVAQTYSTDNPTLLRKVESARPKSFAETPIAFVGTRNETVLLPGGDVMHRIVRPTLYVVAEVPDNIEAAERMDALADALLVIYSNAYHQVSGSTLLTPIGLEDVELEVGDVSYPGFAITFEALEIRGRPGKALYVNPLTATPEALVVSLHGVGLVLSLAAVTATGETLLTALQAIGLLMALNPLTATPEDIANALIAANLMEAS